MHFLQVNQEPNLFLRGPFLLERHSLDSCTSVDRHQSIGAIRVLCSLHLRLKAWCKIAYSSCSENKNSFEKLEAGLAAAWQPWYWESGWRWPFCTGKKDPPPVFETVERPNPHKYRYDPEVWPPCRILWDSRPRGQFRDTNLAKPRPIWPVFATKRPYDMLRDSINLSDVERSGTVKSTLFYSIHKIGYAAAHCSRLPLYSLLGCTCCASDKYK